MSESVDIGGRCDNVLGTCGHSFHTHCWKTLNHVGNPFCPGCQNKTRFKAWKTFDLHSSAEAPLLEPSAPPLTLSEELEMEMAADSDDNEVEEDEPEEPEDDQDERKDECCICMDATIETVMVPCGHRCCCVLCGPGQAKCPICQTAVQTCIKTFDIH